MMKINNFEQIENNLQKILPCFFGATFITTGVGSFYGFLDHHSIKMGDWLINYQGGFIQRGFLGEIVWHLSRLTQINPGLIIFIIQTLCYGIFFLVSYDLVKKKKSLLPYALLIFSPFLFLFQISDLLGGFRKEIIYIAAFSVLVWCSHKRQNIFTIVFYLMLGIYPFIILTHEMLSIFLPYLIILYFLTHRTTIKNILLPMPLLLVSVFSLFLAITFSVDPQMKHQIAHSLERLNYPVDGGTIEWMNNNISFGINLTVYHFNLETYEYYVIILALSLLSFIPIYPTIKIIFENRLTALLFATTISGSILLFIIAMDWGRFIYLHLVSLFLLSVSNSKTSADNTMDSDPQGTLNRKLSLFINRLATPNYVYGTILCYTLLWYMPHAGDPLKGISRPFTVIVGFLRPYGEVLRKLLE